MILKSIEVSIVPNKTPEITLHDATLVKSSTAKPTKIASVEVSPIDPGIKPKNAFDQL